MYFEEDFPRVKRRANDWAQGRADALVDPSSLRGMGDACGFPPLIPEGSPDMEELRRKEPELAAGLAPMLTGNREEGEAIGRQRWLEAAEAALARNAVTFSVLAVEDVVARAGWFKAAGQGIRDQHLGGGCGAARAVTRCRAFRL